MLCQDESRLEDILVDSAGGPVAGKKSSFAYRLPNSPDLLKLHRRSCILNPPDAVLRFLREHGYTTSHIPKLVRNRPKLLTAQPEKTLLPKLEFLRSIGVSSSELPRILCMNPVLLVDLSLNHGLVPFYDLLRTVIGCEKKVVQTLGRIATVNVYGITRHLATNVSILRGLGMPQSVVSHLVSRHPKLASLKPSRLTQNVNKLIQSGLDPSSFHFVVALDVISGLTQKTRERKVEVFMRCSLSEDQVWAVFRMSPMCMLFSEEKISSTIDFLVSKMNWKLEDVINHPNTVTFSLDRWIIPRWLVVRILLLKGLINEEATISSVVQSGKDRFLKKFVIDYLEQVPQLLDVFLGKMTISELSIGPHEEYGFQIQ